MTQRRGVLVDPGDYRVHPGQVVDLGTVETSQDGGYSTKELEGRAAELNEELEALQELLYAQGRHKVLIVLQAIDAGGKDSTIRHVFDGTNPQGVKVASFKKPTSIELAHDYLWRVHEHAPASGHMTIFNRSHYEDVLVVRVHDLVPEERWKRRYEHINGFERMLTDEGTTIVKFFLHISKAEQKRRFESRIQRKRKQWKFARADLDERERWDDYQAAFTEMLERTSQSWAPWFIVPADNKRYRDVLISTVLVDTLRGLDMQWPPVEAGIDTIVVPD